MECRLPFFRSCPRSGLSSLSSRKKGKKKEKKEKGKTEKGKKRGGEQKGKREKKKGKREKGGKRKREKKEKEKKGEKRSVDLVSLFIRLFTRVCLRDTNPPSSLTVAEYFRDQEGQDGKQTRSFPARPGTPYAGRQRSLTDFTSASLH